jgi:hypothetical protein
MTAHHHRYAGDPMAGFALINHVVQFPPLTHALVDDRQLVREPYAQNFAD